MFYSQVCSQAFLQLGAGVLTHRPHFLLPSWGIGMKDTPPRVKARISTAEKSTDTQQEQRFTGKGHPHPLPPPFQKIAPNLNYRLRGKKIIGGD